MDMIRKKDEFAPLYHLYAGKGWINDPCGCSLYHGEYHVFFQYHKNPVPYGKGKWFHIKSQDLIHWEELGVCLQPEFPYEDDGCWTGSSLEKDGLHYIFYSTNRDGRLPQQQPAVACSEDGLHYRKCFDGPVITTATPDGHLEMRDPKVFLHGEYFYMLEGATRDGKGEVIGYRSRDGKKWDYQGIFFQSEKWMGSMFECPDFFSLNGRDFLIISPMNWIGHKNILLCGKADFDAFRFRCDQVVDLDLGSDFYAAQSFRLKDGRVAILGWLGNWGKPHPEERCGWAGMLSCIRIVNYDRDSDRVYFSPIEKLNELRMDTGTVFTVTIGDELMTANELSGAHKDIVIDKIEFAAEQGRTLYLSVGNGIETAIEIGLNFEENLISVDKTMAAQGDNSSVIVPCRLDRAERIRLLLDGSALELFTGDGQVISERFYVDTENLHVTLRCKRETAKCSIICYNMGSLYKYENE